MSTIRPLVPQIPWGDVKTLDPCSALYLVRHGESASNQSEIPVVSGKGLHVNLTAAGRKQAADLALKLIEKMDKSVPITIYTSTANRARQTAEAMCTIFQKHQFKCELANQEYPDLCELGQGDWEGKERNEEYRRQIKNWDYLPLAQQLVVPKVEGAESYAAVAKRALSVLSQIFQESEGKIVFVVTHGNTMNGIAFQLNREQLTDNGDLNKAMINPNNCDLFDLRLSKDASIPHMYTAAHLRC